jgi:hypothetical protein
MIFSESISTFFKTFVSPVVSTDAVLQQLREVIASINIFKHISNIQITDDEIVTMADIFVKIGKFFNIKFLSLHIDNTEHAQTMCVTSFAEIFTQLMSMHVHQNVDSTDYEIAYPKVTKEQICHCVFHEEELFEHLHICAIISGIYAIRNNANVFNITLTALLHDIGKPSCIRIFDSGNLGYPYHGEYGAMILSRLYTPDFIPFISHGDYQKMMRTISIHMCSYHITDFQSNWNNARINSTRIECDEVKTSLMYLSYGDVFSAFSKNNDKTDFIKTRDIYHDMIDKPYVDAKTKYVFIVRGRSGSGKSHISKILADLVQTYGLTVKHVMRDMIIVNIVRVMQGHNEIDYRPTQDEYAQYYQYYRDNKLGSIVNDKLKQQITYSINMFDVTIIDTQMSMFRGFDQIIPSNISSCVVFGFDVSRNMLIENDQKNGNNLTEQLQMFGSSSTFAPLDMNGIAIFSMASAYTHNTQPVGIVCDFVFPLGYNIHFNGINTIGLDYFKEFFTRYVSVAKTSEHTISLVNTDDMNIVEYVNYLYTTNNKSYDAVVQILRAQAYQVGPPSFLRGTPDEELFLSIKYLDHNNIWNKWGREARGTTLILDNGVCYMHKFLTQRGAEAVTGMQIKRGINKTDNIDTKMDFKASHLSRDQQSLIQDLREGNPVNLVLSFKKDGSMLSCCLYTSARAQIMRRIIETYGDEFTKTVMYLYYAISDTDDVFVFQSQSTLLIGEFMYDYTTTAIFPDAIPILTPIEKMKTYGTSFMIRMRDMFAHIPGIVKHIIGETICANRTESYSGNVHRELAMSYPTSSFTILSITSIFTDSYEIKPHYCYSELINKCSFSEPAFWNCTSVEQVDKLIQDVDGYIFKKITVDEFYTRNPPSNKYNYDKIIDCEGFVTYDLNRNNSYGKIKTDSYYKSHKLRDDNIAFLCELNTVAGHIFPLARIVADTISQLDVKLNMINQEMIKMIASPDMIAHLPAKASNGFANRPRAVQFKIIINMAKDMFAQFAFEIFQKHFPSLVMSDDMKTMCVNYAMKTELWLDVPKQIDETTRSFIVSQLIGMSH